MKRPDTDTNRYVLDEQGIPRQELDLMAWAKWFESFDRHIAKDEIKDVLVSTVFLGLDYSFNGGDPVLWETMIFGGAHDETQLRYTSREEAMKGHREAVELVKHEMA